MSRLMIAAALLCGGFAVAQEPGKLEKVELKDAKGQKVGEVSLEQTPNGVLITGDFTNLPVGMHAFHVHETGKCEPPFKSAGGHFNPTTKKHGIKNKEGKHGGDMPNIDVPAGGKAKFQVLNPDISLKPGDKASLLDADGSAFVIHAGVDDHMTDPAGNAGDRIACGAIAGTAPAAPVKAAPAPAKK